MRRFPFLLLLLITGLCRPAEAVEAVAGHALFRAVSARPQVELYWKVNPATLHYSRDSAGRLVTRIHTRLRITADTGVVYSDDYYLQTKPFDPAAQDAPTILEIARAGVPEGLVRLELYLSEDAHPESRFYYRDTLRIPSLSGPSYSSVQLLDTFFATTKPGPFLKDRFFQQPRPLNFFDEGERRLHTYTELYGTAGLAAGAFPLSQTVYISRSRGERDIAGHLLRDTIKAGAPLLRFRNSFTLADLPSGNYFINVSLRSAAGLELASEATFFQTINKHPEVAADTSKAPITSVEQVQGNYLDLSKTFVSKFDIPQLRSILKMLIPAAEPAEVSAIKGFLERPDELYMRYFIYNHFLNINKADPARAWKEFSDVVREVNRLYKSGNTMGYETDRGVIHLRYGPPTEVVRVPAESGALPYEIWRYNVGHKIQGSGLFLFYSPGYMNSDFRLLHSTVPGERQNPGWRSVLYSTGRSSGNANARAEQYFGN